MDSEEELPKFIQVESKLVDNATYIVLKEMNVYFSANDALYTKNAKGKVSPGAYYIYKVSENMFNISSEKGQVGSWINPTENQGGLPLNNAKPYEFISKVSNYAMEAAKDKDVYTSVMMAQAILETGYGQSLLSKEPTNNLFGIKGNYEGESTVIPTFEYDRKGNSYDVMAGFRKYPTVKESFDDYVSLITGDENPTNWRYNFYKGARISQTKTYKDATKYLTGRYATAPNYYEILDNIIEKYDLTKYDHIINK